MASTPRRSPTLTGVNRKTLQGWASIGFVTPSIEDAHGSGSRRIWSLRDIIALRAAMMLRYAGVSLQGLRQVATYLQQCDSVEQPLGATLLVTSVDGDVLEVRGRDELVSCLRRAGN